MNVSSFVLLSPYAYSHIFSSRSVPNEVQALWSLHIATNQTIIKPDNHIIISISEIDKNNVSP